MTDASVNLEKDVLKQATWSKTKVVSALSSQYDFQVDGVAESDAFFGVPSSDLFPVPAEDGNVVGINEEEKKELSECES